MNTTMQSLRKGNCWLRTLFAGVLSLAMLLSCFHGSACETEVRGALSGTAVVQQPQPDSHPVAQHQLADHCLSHLVGDLSHPSATAILPVVKVELIWRDEASRSFASPDSPFKPPRV